MERVNGIEPSYAAWEAAVLPLNYTREPAHSTRVAGNTQIDYWMVSRLADEATFFFRTSSRMPSLYLAWDSASSTS